MTITKLQLVIMTLSVTLIAAGGMSDAFAMPQIRLTEGGGANNALITDQVVAGDADENGVAGIVQYTKAIGAFSNINFEVGITKPNTGTPTMPNMSFILLTSSGAAGTLVAEFTDVDFTNGLIQCQSVGGGTTFGTVTYSVYMDPGNVPFGQAQLLFTTTQSGAGPVFNIDANGAFGAAPGATYSLTMVTEIEHFAVNDLTSLSFGLVCVEDDREIVKDSNCPEEFGIYSPVPVQCKVTITYTTTDSNSPPVRILDKFHAEFAVIGTSANTGVVSLIQTQEGSGTTIQWDLNGGPTIATLMIDIETVENPGKGHGKKNNVVFKPTSCGPLPINDGATAFELDPTTGLIVLDINLEPVVIIGPSNVIIAQAVTGTKDCEVPHTIKRLTITQGDPGELILDWRDNGDAELLGYKIYRDIGCTGTFILLATIGTSSSEYTDIGLASGIYCYIVTAFNSEGESTDSKKDTQSIMGTVP